MEKVFILMTNMFVKEFDRDKGIFAISKQANTKFLCSTLRVTARQQLHVAF